MSFETIFAIGMFFVSLLALLAASIIADRARGELAKAKLFSTDSNGVPCVWLVIRYIANNASVTVFTTLKKAEEFAKLCETDQRAIYVNCVAVDGDATNHSHATHAATI